MILDRDLGGERLADALAGLVADADTAHDDGRARARARPSRRRRARRDECARCSLRKARRRVSSVVATLEDRATLL